jgi:hypothetical protein
MFKILDFKHIINYQEFISQLQIYTMVVNKWIKHVKAFHAKHPNLSYSEAMKKARASYNPGKSGSAVRARTSRVGSAVRSRTSRTVKRKTKRGGAHPIERLSDIFKNRNINWDKFMIDLKK